MHCHHPFNHKESHSSRPYDEGGGGNGSSSLLSDSNTHNCGLLKVSKCSQTKCNKVNKAMKGLRKLF